MKRYLLCLLLSSVFLVQAFSQNTLNLFLKNGSSLSFVFTDKPVICYSADSLFMRTEHTHIEYPISELDRITFTNSEDKPESINYYLADETSSVTIFDISGRIISTYEDDGNHTLDISLTGLENGIYIIRQGDKSYKITKQ